MDRGKVPDRGTGPSEERRSQFTQEEANVQPGYGPFPQAPICLALVLARAVSYSEEIGVWSIIGPYSFLPLQTFPAQLVSMEAYVVLTACDGTVLVELQMVDVNGTRPPVFRQLVSVSFNGPKDVQEIIFHNYNPTIPAADEYRLLLTVYRSNFTHPEFVLERSLFVVQAP
jgi:hypothetical protein